jgi:type IV pilus assembly protein PilV
MRGLGLIEVLVALVVLTFGLLGIAAMQVTTLRNSQSSMGRSQAVVHSYAILDAMRANRDRAVIGAYNMLMTCDLPDDNGDLASGDLHAWVQSLHDSLGSTSCGSIACNDLTCLITVQWDDSRGTQANVAARNAAATHQLATSTRL